MPPFISGSNLTDLSRNSLAANEQDNQARQATANLLLNQLAQANARRLAERDMALRQQAQQDQNAYLNNALAQQGRISNMQWNTPNATQVAQLAGQKEVALYPWTQGMTPAQAAANRLGEDQIHNQLAIANAPYDYARQTGMPIGGNQYSKEMADMMFEASQRPVRLQRALNAANAAYAVKQGEFSPFASDSGQAEEVIKQLSTVYPEAAELQFTGKGFSLPENTAQSAPVSPFGLMQPQGSRTNAFPPSASGSPVKGKPLDAVTAKQILLQASGDKDKARLIAAQMGYAF